jgi:hypothetical protein
MVSKEINFHETFRSDEPVSPSSRRQLGFVLAAVFAIFGLVPLIHAGKVRGWPLIVAGIFLASAIFAPRLLSPLLWLWTQVGNFLAKITNPILLGLIFYGALLPTGLILRAFGRRPLNLSFEPDQRSYWVKRHPPGPAPRNMKKQF